MVDHSLWDADGTLRPAGRQPAARVERARAPSTAPGSPAVRIVVSGGFTADKIRRFEAGRRARRRLRRGLEPDPGRERLHGRRRPLRGPCRPPRSGAASCPTASSSCGESSGARASCGTSTRSATSCLRHGRLVRARAPRRCCPRCAPSWSGPGEHGIVHVASADDHELGDPEISDDARLRRHLPAALPARDARRGQGGRDRAGRSAAARRARLPAGTASSACSRGGARSCCSRRASTSSRTRAPSAVLDVPWHQAHVVRLRRRHRRLRRRRRSAGSGGAGTPVTFVDDASAA